MHISVTVRYHYLRISYSLGFTLTPTKKTMIIRLFSQLKAKNEAEMLAIPYLQRNKRRISQKRKKFASCSFSSHRIIK